MLNNADVVINLKLLKTFRFYQIFDPHGQKCFGWNVYRLTLITFAALNECLFSFCLGCFLMHDKGSDNVFEVINLAAVYMEHYLFLWQMCVFFYHADDVWKIFNVSQLNFFTSKGCTKNIRMLLDERARCIKITDWFTVFTISVIFQWLMYPLINYWFVASLEDHPDQRPETIFNIPFPVNVNMHYKYYYVFYFVEFLMELFCTYSLIVYDVFVFSVCRVISCQYEVLTCAFESVGGYEDTVNLHCDEEYKHFNSILSDKIRLDDMAQTYYTVMKPVVLMRVALISSTIISFAYVFIVICSSAESVSVTDILKFGSTLTYASLQLFMYCYLFNNISISMESVNFGIYSCNWTMMNLKFKELVLLAMRMNDSTQLIMKASPKKIINLELFGNVMMTSYNVLSVMVKTLNKKNT